MAVRRVAMVLNSPGLGGVPEVVRALSTRLPADRYEPHIFLLKPGEAAGMAAFTDLGFEPTVADPAGGKMSVIAQLAGWLSDRRIDILHTHSFRPNLYGRMAGALCRPGGLRIVSHYHNEYDEKWRAEPAAALLEARLTGVTDAMIAVSPAVRDHIATVTGTPGDRIAVIENGVDLARFGGADRVAGRRMLGLSEGEFAVGVVGRICRQKGQDIALEAIREVSDLPNLRLVVVGNREDERMARDLEQGIEAAGLQSRVRLTGHMSDTAPVMAALDLLLVPSRWEGFGLVLLEAMAAGTPIVATRVGGIPGVVGDSRAALVLAPEDPGALARAIHLLARDSAVQGVMGNAGRKRARAFSWARSAERVAGVYAALQERVPG